MFWEGSVVGPGCERFSVWYLMWFRKKYIYKVCFWTISKAFQVIWDILSGVEEVFQELRFACPFLCLFCSKECTVQPQFYITTFCVSHDFAVFLYGPGQIPINNVSQILYHFRWCPQKHSIGVLCVCYWNEIYLNFVCSADTTNLVSYKFFYTPIFLHPSDIFHLWS